MMVNVECVHGTAMTVPRILGWTSLGIHEARDHLRDHLPQHARKAGHGWHGFSVMKTYGKATA